MKHTYFSFILLFIALAIGFCKLNGEGKPCYWSVASPKGACRACSRNNCWKHIPLSIRRFVNMTALLMTRNRNSDSKQVVFMALAWLSFGLDFILWRIQFLCTMFPDTLPVRTTVGSAGALLKKKETKLWQCSFLSVNNIFINYWSKYAQNPEDRASYATKDVVLCFNTLDLKFCCQNC